MTMSNFSTFVDWFTGNSTSEKAEKRSDSSRGKNPPLPTSPITKPDLDTARAQHREQRKRKWNQAYSAGGSITGNLQRGARGTYERVTKPPKMRNQVRRKEIISSTNFQVTKELNGDYRWYAISSNAFLDGDREIVSTKALEKDAENNTERGPLRWWHEPQLNLGTTDFSAMHGKMLIESGTFTTKEVAERIAQNASNLSMSVGFIHPASEPDSEGVFHNIRIFERSLLPTVSAANKFTQFHVMEDTTMNEKKYKALTDLVGEALVQKIIEGAEVTEKEALSVGLRYKEKDTTAEEAIDIVDSMSDEEVTEFLDGLIAEKELADGVSGDEADDAGEDEDEGDDEPEMDTEEDDELEDDDEAEAEDEDEDEDEAVTEKAHAKGHGKGKAEVEEEEEEEEDEEDALENDDEAEEAVDELTEEIGKGKKKAVPMAASMKYSMKKPSMSMKSSDDSDLIDPRDMSRDELIDLLYEITEKGTADDEGEYEGEYEDEDEDEVETVKEGDPDVAYMSPSELSELLTGTISEVFGEMKVAEKMSEVYKELRTIRAVIKQIDGRVNAGLESVTVKERNTSSLLDIIDEMNIRLKELEGEAPKSSKRSYRASQDDDTEIEEGHRLKQAQPADDPLDHFRMFLNGNRE